MSFALGFLAGVAFTVLVVSLSVIWRAIVGDVAVENPNGFNRPEGP